jgi:heat shock protein HslJ
VAPYGLVGHTFRITAIVEDQKDVPIVEGTEPTLTFTADKFHVETGCNRLLAEYEVDDEGRLVAGQIRQTLMSCSRDRLLQEDRIRRALAAHPRLEVDADEITLRSAALVLVATPAS